MYQLSPKRLETWRSEWRVKVELAFPRKGAQPQSKLDADRISELERKIGPQTMGIDLLKKALRCFRKHPVPAAVNGGTDSMSKSKRRAKRDSREPALPGRGNKSGGLLPFPATRKKQAHGYGST